MQDFIRYAGDELRMESVRVAEIAENFGTPCYAYSENLIAARYRELAAAFRGQDTLICYAIKANSNQAIIRVLASLGAGADVVSGGELYRAQMAGIPSQKIVFAGVGKTDAEIRQAIADSILHLNVESVPELHKIQEIARAMDKPAPVLLRVNPDVEANTHQHIRTGSKEDKFGLDAAALAAIREQIVNLSHIRFLGVGLHIGSQIFDLDPFVEAYEYLRDVAADFSALGLAPTHIDLGGGLGVSYDGLQKPLDLASYAAMVQKIFSGFIGKFILEPGRYLVAEAGILLTRVLYVKETAHKTFILVDAGMNDLIRPALYEAYHQIHPAYRRHHAAIDADIVGPVCESGDYFALSRRIEKPQSGDLLSIFHAGAYGASMSSLYNSRPLAAEVLVKDKEFHGIRKRMTYAEMLRSEQLAPWQTAVITKS